MNRVKPIRSLVTDRRGVAAMEFALVAPILLLIIFATIEYGWYLTQCIVINNAVAQGARAAVKARQWETVAHGIEDPIQFTRAALLEALWSVKNLTADYIDIRILEADETAPRRIQVKVIDLPYRPLTGYLGKNHAS